MWVRTQFWKLDYTILTLTQRKCSLQKEKKQEKDAAPPGSSWQSFKDTKETKLISVKERCGVARGVCPERCGKGHHLLAPSCDHWLNLPANPSLRYIEENKQTRNIKRREKKHANTAKVNTSDVATRFIQTKRARVTTACEGEKKSWAQAVNTSRSKWRCNETKLP